MSLLRRLAVNNITKHFRISFLTVLSVAVSVSMITVVIASSLGIHDELRRETLEKSSRENVMIHNVTDVKGLLNDIGRDHIEAFSVRESYQLAILNPNKIERNKLFYLEGIDPKHQEQFQPVIKSKFNYDFETTILEGRAPQNENEIAISSLNVAEQKGEIGQKAYRIDEDKGNEKRPPKERIYHYNPAQEPLTIVGITSSASSQYFYDNQKLEIRPDRKYSVALKFKPQVHQFKSLVEGALKHKNVAISSDYPDGSNIRYNTNYNQAIGLDTDVSSTKLSLAISGFIFILILLAATFTLVFNAFNVLVDTNVKTYGLLRSIGATKRQIKHTIRVEGLILSLLGGVLGCGLGFGLSQLLFMFINPQIEAFSTTYNAAFVFHFSPVLPATVIALIVFASLIIAAIPLHLAVRKMFLQTSIEGIRHANLNDHKVKKKVHLKVGKSINYQIARINNRSAATRSRGIQTALVITIILFVSLSSLSYSIFSTIGNYGQYDHNISVDLFTQTQPSYAKVDAYLNNEPLITNLIKKETSRQAILYPDGTVIKNSDDIKEDSHSRPLSHHADFVFISDERYQTLRQESGITNAYDNGVLLLNFHGKVSFTSNDTPISYELNGPITKLKEQETFVIAAYEDQEYKAGKQQFKVEGYLKNVPDDLKRSYPEVFILIPLSRKEAFIKGDAKDGESNQAIQTFYKVEATNPTVVHQRLLDIDPDLQIINYAQKQALLRQIRFIIDTIMTATMVYIGSVSIMNMISITITNYTLRKQILAIYRSVGMSRRTLQKVFVFESLLTFMWPLILGVGIGATIPILFWGGLSWANSDTPFLYKFDAHSISIAIGFIILATLVNSVTLYFQSKKHSIIEEMRHV